MILVLHGIAAKWSFLLLYVTSKTIWIRHQTSFNVYLLLTKQRGIVSFIFCRSGEENTIDIYPSLFLPVPDLAIFLNVRTGPRHFDAEVENR